MFARDFVHLDHPFERVAPRFTGMGLRLEPIVASVLAEVPVPAGAVRGPGSPWPPAPSCVRGPTRAREGSLIIPMSWSFDPDPWELSPLKTDLTIAPIDATQCVVSVEALVRRPSRIRADDPQHAVETLLRAFLRALAVAIDRER